MQCVFVKRDGDCRVLHRYFQMSYRGNESRARCEIKRELQLAYEIYELHERSTAMII